MGLPLFTETATCEPSLCSMRVLSGEFRDATIAKLALWGRGFKV